MPVRMGSSNISRMTSFFSTPDTRKYVFRARFSTGRVSVSRCDGFAATSKRIPSRVLMTLPMRELKLMRGWLNWREKWGFL